MNRAPTGGGETGAARGSWRIGAVKREGRRALKPNFLVCFLACLLVSFVAHGALSVSDTLNLNEEAMRAVATQAQGTPLGDAASGMVDAVDRFRRSAGLGMASTAGGLGNAYRKIAQAGGLSWLIADAVAQRFAAGADVSGAADAAADLADAEDAAVDVIGAADAAAGTGSAAEALDSAEADAAAIAAAGRAEDVRLLVAIAVGILLYIFLGGILEIGLARLFLEVRRGEPAQLRRIFFLYRVGRARRAALTVLLRSVTLCLWACTVVGFPIQWYAYRLVPWIVAENPDVRPREALRRSAALMAGHKWRSFLFDLSFLPWLLLSIATFGILWYVWLAPYRQAAKTALYAAILGAEPAPATPELRPLPAVLERAMSHIGAKPQYPLLNIAMMFFAFSFLGWVFECTLWLVEDGLLVNRGTMYGPWIPIYGVGGIVILLVVNRFYSKPVTCFFLIIAVCAPIEYIGAWILWQSRHLKYWDYSGYFLNLDGRICLEGMLNFAVLGTLGIYVLAPFFDSLLCRIPFRRRLLLCVALFALFAVDAVLSHIYPRAGLGITDHLQ